MNRPVDLDIFARRLVQEAIASALPATWLRRGDQFSAVGTPTCDLIALNCRRHAALLEELGLDQETRDLIDRELGGGAAA